MSRFRFVEDRDRTALRNEPSAEQKERLDFTASLQLDGLKLSDGRTSCAKISSFSPLSFLKARNTFNTARGVDAKRHCSLARRSRGRSGDFEVFGFNKSKREDHGASCKTRAHVEVVARPEVKRANCTFRLSGLQQSMVRICFSLLVAMHVVSRMKEI